MILQKKEELANRQLRLTITVERDAWEKALNDAYQEVKALYPVEGYAVGKAPREALEKAYRPSPPHWWRPSPPKTSRSPPLPP